MMSVDQYSEYLKKFCESLKKDLEDSEQIKLLDCIDQLENKKKLFKNKREG